MTDLQLHQVLHREPPPLYVFALAALPQRVATLREHLPEGVGRRYAVKANPFLLSALNGVVERFEICSPGELVICQQAGLSPDQYVLSGVYKEPAAMGELVAQGEIGCYTVESMTQFSVLYGAALAAWPLPEDMVPADIPVRADRFADADAGVHVIISLGNTLQQYYANMNKTREWLPKLDFILHVGMYDEDSAAFADVVLPVCSKFEDTVEHSIVRGGYNHIQLSQKCIDPLFESKPDYDVMYLIAKSVGLESVLPEDAEQLARFQIDEATDPLVAGITFDALVQNHNTMPLAGIEEPRIGYADLQFPTSTGRMEIYYEPQHHSGQALPQWEENNEVFDGNPLMEKYPLQLAQTRTRFFVHSHFRGAAWLAQFYTPRIELNPQAMAERGLEDGDAVEVFNDRGSFSCQAFGNNAIRPTSARIYEAAWSKDCISGNPQNDHVNDRDADLLTGAPIPFNDTLVEVRKA